MRRVLDRSILSSGLCHVRCACMAGQKKLIKKGRFLGFEGETAWVVFFSPGSLPLTVLCVLLFASFPVSYLLRRYARLNQANLRFRQLRLHPSDVHVYFIIFGRPNF